MLKVFFIFKILTFNNKYIKTSPLILLLLLNNLVQSENLTIGFYKHKKQIKTLLLSPFHYKVAKKNLIKKTITVSLSFKILNLLPNKAYNFIFFHKKHNILNKTNFNIIKIQYKYTF